MGRMGYCNVVGSNDPLFYGFLLAGEVVLPSDTEFDPAQHLMYEDISLDDKQPSFITVNKAIKNRFFRKRVTGVIGQAVGPLCPLVATLLHGNEEAE